jgi:Sel1 repeat/GAF domain
MSQRLSLDRRSFKQFLSTLFQQIQIPGLHGSADDRIDPECLPDLMQIRQEVKGGRFDLNAVIDRLTKLTQRVVSASGVGVWLFTSDEVFLHTETGSASNDERLRLEVISKLASECQLSQHAASRRTAIDTGYDAKKPGDTNSLLVEPIHQGPNIAGALAVLSDECNAFTERDGANLHLLADLLGQALGRAADSGLQEGVTLAPAATLALIERIIPALQRMLESCDAHPSAHGFLHREPEHELPGTGIHTKPLPDCHEPGPATGGAETTGGTRAGHDRVLPASRGDSTSASPLQELSVSRTGLRTGWKNKLAKIYMLGPAIRQKWERASAWVTNFTSHLAAAAQPNAVVQRGLDHTLGSFLHATKLINTQFQMFLHSRSNRRVFLKAAPVMAIVAIAGTFLILKKKADLHGPAQTAAPRSRATPLENTTPANAVLPDSREEPVPEQFGTSAHLQVSHMRVTDRATEAAVRTLSRFELAGLRRRAEYGDDSAAFEMGMAYEIGRGVPQRCATAAQWVAKAAREGNTAAQYNLGLRYRDGDGLPRDEDQAAKWLQKAAIQHSSDARVALGVLTTHQERVIPSLQTSR